MRRFPKAKCAKNMMTTEIYRFKKNKGERVKGMKATFKTFMKKFQGREFYETEQNRKNHNRTA
jgi:hypothetical protein